MKFKLQIKIISLAILIAGSATYLLNTSLDNMSYVHDPLFEPVVLSDPRIQAAHDMSVNENGILVTVSKGRNATGAPEDGLGTLAIIDVSDPENPTVISHVAGFYDAQTVEIFGPYVYVGDNKGIHVFNIANPSNPVKIHFLDLTAVPGLHLENEINGWKLYKEKLFLASKRGKIIVLDVSDLSNPILPNNDWWRDVGNLDQVGSPHDLDIVDDVLSIASRTDWNGGTGGTHYAATYRIFDNSGNFILPKDWALLGSIDNESSLGGANRIRYANGRLYFSTFNSSERNPAWLDSFFRVIKTNNFINLEIEHEVIYPLEFESATASNGLAVDFPWAAVLAGRGILIYDISRPLPVLLKSWWDENGVLTGMSGVSGHDGVFYGDYFWGTFEDNNAILGFPLPHIKIPGGIIGSIRGGHTKLSGESKNQTTTTTNSINIPSDSTTSVPPPPSNSYDFENDIIGQLPANVTQFTGGSAKVVNHLSLGKALELTMTGPNPNHKAGVFFDLAPNGDKSIEWQDAGDAGTRWGVILRSDVLENNSYYVQFDDIASNKLEIHKRTGGGSRQLMDSWTLPTTQNNRWKVSIELIGGQNTIKIYSWNGSQFVLYQSWTDTGGNQLTGDNIGFLTISGTTPWVSDNVAFKSL